MTDPTTTPAALPDELQRLLNAASALVQRSAHIGGHVVTEPSDHAALREALAPARAAAEGLAERVEAKQRGADMLRECLEIEYAGRKDAEAGRGLAEMRAARWKAATKLWRHEAKQQARAAQMWRGSHTAASLTVVQQAEELARLRAERDAAQARADRLAAERREGIAREARLALVVERLVSDLWAAEVVLDGRGFKAAADDLRARREAITTTTAPDAAPAALLQAMRAVPLAKLAFTAPMKPLDEVMAAIEAVQAADAALRAAGLAGEGE